MSLRAGSAIAFITVMPSTPAVAQKLQPNWSPARSRVVTRYRSPQTETHPLVEIRSVLGGFRGGRPRTDAARNHGGILDSRWD